MVEFSTRGDGVAQGRQRRGDRAGGENQLVECHERIGDFRILALIEPQGRGVVERTAGMNHADVAPLGQLAQAARERLDQLVLALPQGVHVDLRPCEVDPPVRP